MNFEGLMERFAEYTVFGILMAANFGFGLYFSFYKRSRKVTADEVFLGSRTLMMLPLAMSALASIMSSLGIISVTGHVYAHGAHIFWNHILAPINAAITAYIIVPVLYRLRVTSIFEVGVLVIPSPRSPHLLFVFTSWSRKLC